MEYKYIKAPSVISYSDINNNDATLSSSRYAFLNINNQNTVCVSDFLGRNLTRKDLGSEVGSIHYIPKSTHFFMRTKALKKSCYVPELTDETCQPIRPGVFYDMQLQKGDMIISKDSNIGEVVILDRDYPTMMLSGALYKLPIKDHKYYLMAFMKHDIFREQLDYLVPRGATIRHAKTLFLDCKIPMPNHDRDRVIRMVENTMQAIVKKEI